MSEAFDIFCSSADSKGPLAATTILFRDSSRVGAVDLNRLLVWMLDVHRAAIVPPGTSIALTPAMQCFAAVVAHPKPPAHHVPPPVPQVFTSLPLLLFIICTVLGGIALAFRTSTAKPPAEPSKPDAPPPKPPAEPLPYKKQNYFFSVAERSFYETLIRLLPNHTVFPKVRLSDVLHVEKGARAYTAWLGRIAQEHLDFVICDHSMAPVVVIKLDSTSPTTEDATARDKFIIDAIEAADLPLVRIKNERAFVVEEIKNIILPVLPPPPSPTPRAAALQTPQQRWAKPKRVAASQPV